MQDRTYISIDLKSFYASVECCERGLNPLDTNLVVADNSRTDKTICLAVTPSLKSYGIPGRGRLFEVKQKVKEENAKRKLKNNGKAFIASSYYLSELQSNPELAIDFIIAVPRMSLYVEYSTRIHQIYLKYIAPEDIIVYSIDEVFMDVTYYLSRYKMTARELTIKMILEVLSTTGITATAGIGSNLYLSKIAMDIMAKRILPDENGVRIAELNEMSYRLNLWEHRPLTDFWRIGHGYANKLQNHGIYTMGDVARCSVQNETLLYTLFGKNAELLIDHAWGWEPCTMEIIKAYRPSAKSISSGQILLDPYPAHKAKLVLHEMLEGLALDLVEKELCTKQIVISIGYDVENLKDPARRENYHGDITIDYYGRHLPKHAHSTVNLARYTSSAREITQAALTLFDDIVDKNLSIRRLQIAATNVLPDTAIEKQGDNSMQLSLFTDYTALETQRRHEEKRLQREKKMQLATLHIKRRFGKNALLKGMNLEEGATARQRNMQIGGHRA